MSKSDDLFQNLKKVQEATKIKSKDFSFKSMFKDNKSVVIDVKCLELKYVSKYDYTKDENNVNNTEGFHSTFILVNGKVTGCFSNSAYNFVKTIFATYGVKIDKENNTFAQLDLITGNLKINVKLVDLGNGKSTYDFNIISGEDLDTAETLQLENARKLLEK
jgi:hypothetical protein